jgi:pyruvate/2-oxoglutarate dehydrogenase complex dihydrolipoamide acyltransferase (E2) component
MRVSARTSERLRVSLVLIVMMACGAAAAPAGAAAPVPTGKTFMEISKVTQPAGDATVFAFHLTGKATDAGTVDQRFTLTDGQTAHIKLLKGLYRVVEEVPDGWRVASISCVADNNDGEFSTDPATATANIELSRFENKKCVFTDERVLAPPPAAAPAAPPAAPAPSPTAAPSPPVVRGELLQSPEVSLSAPSACAARQFTVTVSGEFVQGVVFRVNGRTIRTVRVAAQAGRRTFTLRLPVTRSILRVSAQVTFTDAVSPRVRTLSAVIRRCPQLVKHRPSFGG